MVNPENPDDNPENPSDQTEPPERPETEKKVKLLEVHTSEASKQSIFTKLIQQLKK